MVTTPTPPPTTTTTTEQQNFCCEPFKLAILTKPKRIARWKEIAEHEGLKTDAFDPQVYCAKVTCVFSEDRDKKPVDMWLTCGCCPFCGSKLI